MKKQQSYPGELIGKMIQVIKSSNPSLENLTGKIVDETKSTLKVELLEGEVKTLLKNNIIFKIKPDGEIIDGSTIIKKSEDRLKGK